MRLPEKVSLRIALALTLSAVLITVILIFAFEKRMACPRYSTYTIFKEGEDYFAENAEGVIAYSGKDAGVAIQSAINSLKNGGKIFIKSGVYPYSTTLTITDDCVEIEGETIGNVGYFGTILQYTGNSVALQIGASDSSSPIYFVSIKNLMIEGSTNAEGGIKSYNAIYMTLESLHIREFYNGYGITVSSKGHFSEVCLLRNLVLMRVKYGIRFDNENTTNQINYITIDNCNIYGNTTETYQNGSVGIYIAADYEDKSERFEISNDITIKDVRLWFFEKGIENHGYYTRIYNPDFDRGFYFAIYENGNNTLVVHPRFGADITNRWHWGGIKTYVIDNDTIIPLECRVLVPVPNGASNITIQLSRTQEDANYGVSVLPNWSTTVYVTMKNTTHFTINFGTPAGESAKIDWFIYRP